MCAHNEVKFITSNANDNDNYVTDHYHNDNELRERWSCILKRTDKEQDINLFLNKGMTTRKNNNKKTINVAENQLQQLIFILILLLKLLLMLILLLLLLLLMLSKVVCVAAAETVFVVVFRLWNCDVDKR